MSKPTLFICGDSFCYDDIEYEPSWVNLLSNKLPNIDVINLSSPGASNYLISLQVQHALENSCDFLIYHATSSTRIEYSIIHETGTKDHISRYWAPFDRKNKSVVSNSWHSSTRGTDDLLTNNEPLIKEFFSKCVDFPSMITKNYMFIDYTLKLISECMPTGKWAWSRGGFEHPRFTDSKHFKFSKPTNNWNFSKYNESHCPINLWDNFDPNLLRPYYHIVDNELKEKVTECYISMLKIKV